MHTRPEWNHFDPLEPSTHPIDGTDVEFRYANGNSYQGTYGAGVFAHCDLIDEQTEALDKVWQYASASEG